MKEMGATCLDLARENLGQKGSKKKFKFEKGSLIDRTIWESAGAPDGADWTRPC